MCPCLHDDTTWLCRGEEIEKHNPSTVRHVPSSCFCLWCCKSEHTEEKQGGFLDEIVDGLCKISYHRFVGAAILLLANVFHCADCVDNRIMQWHPVCQALGSVCCSSKSIRSRGCSGPAITPFLNSSRFVGFSVEFCYGCFSLPRWLVPLCIIQDQFIHGCVSTKSYRHWQSLVLWNGTHSPKRTHVTYNSKHSIIADTVVILTTCVMTVHAYFEHFIGTTRCNVKLG